MPQPFPTGFSVSGNESIDDRLVRETVAEIFGTDPVKRIARGRRYIGLAVRITSENNKVYSFVNGIEEENFLPDSTGDEGLSAYDTEKINALGDKLMAEGYIRK